MPPVSTLIWALLPVILAALIYQAGLPGSIFAPITEHVAWKVLRNIFTTTHCYTSVRTLSSRLPRAECFTVSNGKFSRVFLDDSSSSGAKQERAGHVIPGLWDGHGHLVQYGESLHSVSLFGAESMAEVKDRLVEYKAGHPEVGTSDQWLRGVGWDQAKFKGRWPTSVCTPGLRDYHHCHVVIPE